MLVAVGFVAVVLVQAQAIGVPSFWYDEAATYAGASRSLPDLWRMAGTVDAVHTLYYALLHPIVALAGPDAGAMRIVSTLAVGLTAVAVYALGRALTTRVTALAAAVLFATFGRVSWMAAEARSFALATLVATLLTLVLIRVLRSRRPALWALGYALLALVGVHLFLYTALVVAAHVVSAVLLRPPRGRRRMLVGAFAVPAVLTVPFGLVVVGQRGQLAGTFPVDGDIFRIVFVDEAFWEALWQGLAVWTVIGLALAVRWRRRRTAIAEGGAVWRVLVPWLALPTLVIVAIAVVGVPVLQPRALVVSAPALALVTAEAVRRAVAPARPGRWLAGVVLVVGLLGVPPYLAARGPESKGADTTAVADILAVQTRPGDGVLYSTPIDYHTWPSLVAVVRPDAVAGLRDVTFLASGVDTGSLFPSRRSAAQAAGALATLDRVWYVRSDALTAAQSAADVSALRDAGLVPGEVVRAPLTTVQEWVRPRPLDGGAGAGG